MKSCIKCKRLRPIAEFIRRNESNRIGKYRSLCFSCRKIYASIRKMAEPEKHRAMGGRARARVDKAKKRADQKRRYANNPRYPQYRQAAALVLKALKDGALRKDSCACLGANCRGQIHAHHNNYNKPLEVVWLCKGHHEAWHQIFAPTYIGDTDESYISRS